MNGNKIFSVMHVVAVCFGLFWLLLCLAAWGLLNHMVEVYSLSNLILYAGRGAITMFGLAVTAGVAVSVLMQKEGKKEW